MMEDRKKRNFKGLNAMEDGSTASEGANPEWLTALKQLDKMCAESEVKELAYFDVVGENTVYPSINGGEFRQHRHAVHPIINEGESQQCSHTVHPQHR